MIASKKTIKKFKTKSKLPTISVCMMVKNEEKNLPRILDSINDLKLADELMIFDTGSTDKTVEVARSYGAKMVEVENVDDYFVDTKWGKKINFSKARNRSFADAKSDWLLLVDADEQLVESEEVKLNTPVHLALKRFLRDLKPDNSAVALIFVDKQQGRDVVRFPPPRIFRRGKVEFRRMVHNSPYGFKEPVILFKGLEVHHFGFDLNKEEKQEKRERTLGLLLKNLEMYPEDHSVYFYMAQIYGDEKEFERCIEYCIKYIRNEPYIERFNPSIYYTLVQACIAGNQRDMADKWLAEAMEKLPEDVDIAMALIDYGVWQKKPHIVTAACEKFLLSYDKMEKDVLSMGSRFVYNFNEFSLMKCLFHLFMIRISQGVGLGNKIKEMLPKVDPELAAGIRDDITREIGKVKPADWVKWEMGEI
jgi:glycosyltransferase involved in cell wall biosynthesis